MFNFYRKSINAEINVLHMGTCHRKLSKKKKSVTNVKQYFPFKRGGGHFCENLKYFDFFKGKNNFDQSCSL